MLSTVYYWNGYLETVNFCHHTWHFSWQLNTFQTVLIQLAMSKLSLEITQSFIQLVYGSFPGVKWLEREAGQNN